MFAAGQTISGTLNLTLTEPKNYRCIQIELHGLAEVKRHHSVIQSKAIVRTVTVLWNSSESIHGMIGPGTYSLAFHFSLPPICPDSFTGSRGSIRYYLQGWIIADGHNHSTVLPIEVIRTSKVTWNPCGLLVPIQYSKSKVVGFLTWKGSVEFVVNLIRSCFCAGEKLPLLVDVINEHPCCIRMKASIKRYRTYCFARSAQCEKQTVATVTSCEINPRDTYSWVVEDLYVPMVEASLDSTIIRVEYKLKVSTIVPMARRVAVKIPITLGNVPFT